MKYVTTTGPSITQCTYDQYNWVYWLGYYDRHSNEWLLYIGSTARPNLSDRIQEHQQTREGVQVVFAAQVPRAKEVETAMHAIMAPFRHRTLPDSFRVSLGQAYMELLPLIHRQSDGRVLH